MVNTKIKINAPFSLANIFGRGDNQNVRSLDFQPTDVILEGKLPIALPYEQTSLEMVIHIDRVRKGKNGGFYDTFRKRLMFPVIDVRGNVIIRVIQSDGVPKTVTVPVQACIAPDAAVGAGEP